MLCIWFVSKLASPKEQASLSQRVRSSRRHPGLEPPPFQDKHRSRVGQGMGHGAIIVSGPAHSRGGEEEHSLETSSRAAGVG